MIRSKYFFLVTFLLLFSYLNSYSNGVGVVNASTGIYLKLTGTSISASVEMQVSVTKSQQLFYNNLGSDKTVPASGRRKLNRTQMEAERGLAHCSDIPESAGY